LALRLSEGLGHTARAVTSDEFLLRTPQGHPVSAEAIAGAVLRRCGTSNEGSVSRSESRCVVNELTMLLPLRCLGDSEVANPHLS
jgi:hypothetical protein